MSEPVAIQVPAADSSLSLFTQHLNSLAPDAVARVAPSAWEPAEVRRAIAEGIPQHIDRMYLAHACEEAQGRVFAVTVTGIAILRDEVALGFRVCEVWLNAWSELEDCHDPAALGGMTVSLQAGERLWWSPADKDFWSWQVREAVEREFSPFGGWQRGCAPQRVYFAEERPRHAN